MIPPGLALPLICISSPFLKLAPTLLDEVLHLTSKPSPQSYCIPNTFSFLTPPSFKISYFEPSPFSPLHFANGELLNMASHCSSVIITPRGASFMTSDSFTTSTSTPPSSSAASIHPPIIIANAAAANSEMTHTFFLNIISSPLYLVFFPNTGTVFSFHSFYF